MPEIVYCKWVKLLNVTLSIDLFVLYKFTISYTNTKIFNHSTNMLIVVSLWLKVMAHCLWQYRCRILFCICTPCIVTGCLFIYIALALCLAFSETYPGEPSGTRSPLLDDYFIAKGTNSSSLLAPHPMRPFWKEELNGEGFWNLIQHVMDRQHNFILHARTNVSENNSTSHLHQYFLISEKILNSYEYFSPSPQIQRFIKYMHFRDYPLLINQPGICKQNQSEAPILLLGIKSQPENFKNRQAIRLTWGHSGLVRGQVGNGGLVRRVFLLGTPKAGLTTYIEEESKTYGDILLWNFEDTFFNLTLKDILFWDWFTKHCANSRFVFKGDDDIFVRTPSLLDYLEKQKSKEFITGDLISAALPVRLENTKYFIPHSFYKGRYPTYPGGGGVLYSGALVPRLLDISKRVHLYPIDDVYVGMCLERLGVIPTHNPTFLTFGFTEEEAKDPCAHHTILMVHKRSPEEMLKLWMEMLIPKSKCKNTQLRNVVVL